MKGFSPDFELFLMPMDETFKVQLPLFEGPFDLLLFFIERDELDIYDIPIATLTDDFLDYLHHLEKLNIEVASEFILVAATLMRIKSKLLLPRPQLDEQNQEIDPREELIKHLLEYRKYKSVIGQFQDMEAVELNKEKRGNVAKELKSLAAVTHVEAELQDIDIFKLLTVFEQVLKRYEEEKNKPTHEVIKYPYTIDGQKDFILSKLKDNTKIAFVALFEEVRTRVALVFNFLAVLEMLTSGLLVIQLGEGYNNFWLMKPEKVEE